MPAPPLKVADSRPAGERAVVTLLARVSPTGKLIVDVEGLLFEVTVTDTKPPEVCPATVTLPVTATAFAGIPRIPATCHDRALPDVNIPSAPMPPGRVSRTRTGAIGTYVVPPVWRCDTLVAQKAAPTEYSLASHAWLGTCGSWATPT